MRSTQGIDRFLFSKATCYVKNDESVYLWFSECSERTCQAFDWCLTSQIKNHILTLNINSRRFVWPLGHLVSVREWTQSSREWRNVRQDAEPPNSSRLSELFICFSLFIRHYQRNVQKSIDVLKFFSQQSNMPLLSYNLSPNTSPGRGEQSGAGRKF